MAWRDGKLTETTIRSLTGNECKLRYGATVHDLKLKAGKSFRWDGK